MARCPTPLAVILLACAWSCTEDTLPIPPGPATNDAGPVVEVSTCGDGVVDPLLEQCDEGMSNSDTIADSCRTNCRLARCGDGVLDEHEICYEPERFVGGAVRSAVGDVDADGLDDVLVIFPGTEYRVGVMRTTRFREHEAIDTFVSPLGELELIDVDGDEDLDLVVAQHDEAFIHVRLNDGSGKFSTTPAATFGDSTPTRFGRVSGADVDNDGDMDLLYRDIDLDQLFVLDGNGDGTFGDRRLIPAAPTSVRGLNGVLAVEDLTGDGVVDIAWGNLALSGPVSFGVLVGDGSGGFAWTGSQIEFEAEIVWIGLRDIDGDGHEDMLFATSRGVIVLDGRDDTRDPFMDYRELPNTSDLLLFREHAREDDRVDLVVGRVVTDGIRVQILRDEGDGTFVATANDVRLEQSEGLVESLAVLHANDDDAIDLAVSRGGPTPRAVELRLGRDGGGFGPATRHLVNDAFRALRTVDLYDDGRSVLFDRVDTVVRTDADGVPRLPPVDRAVASPERVLLVDLDADARLDELVVGPGQAALRLQMAPGLFGSALAVDLAGSDDAIAAADLDDDGRVEVLAQFENTVRIASASSDGSLGPARFVRGSTATAPLVDVDEDGSADLLLDGALYRGDGDGHFVVAGSRGFTSDSNRTLTDLDGDGRPELIVFRPGAAEVLSWADGAFVRQQRISADRPIAVHDLDQDGRPDLVSIGTETIDVFRGVGDGSFETEPRSSHYFRFYDDAIAAAHVVDANRDGHMDLYVVTGWDAARFGENIGVTTLFLGDGTGAFSVRRDFGVHHIPTSAAFADIDGDGMLDFVVTAQAGEAKEPIGYVSTYFASP